MNNENDIVDAAIEAIRSFFDDPIEYIRARFLWLRFRFKGFGPDVNVSNGDVLFAFLIMALTIGIFSTQVPRGNFVPLIFPVLAIALRYVCSLVLVLLRQITTPTDQLTAPRRHAKPRKRLGVYLINRFLFVPLDILFYNFTNYWMPRLTQRLRYIGRTTRYYRIRFMLFKITRFIDGE